MQRRITLAILAVAVAAVVLAGTGTAVLAWVQARHSAVAQLRDEAQALEPFITRDVARQGSAGSEGMATTRAQRIRAAREALRLVDAAVLVVNARGEVASGELPAGVDEAAVLATTTDTGPSDGVIHGLAWAAAASSSNASGRRIVVVLTRRVSFPVGSIRWIMLSGCVAGGLAVLAAWMLARRITGPLREIESATRRIAAGDLSARVVPRAASVGVGPPIAGVVGAAPADEVAALAVSIDVMAGSLEHARSVEQQFLLSISHDLRTPLTSVRGYAEAISDGAVDDPKTAAQVILREAQRMQRLVADLLDLARLEARQFSLHGDHVDLAAIVASSVSGFAPAAQAAQVGLVAYGTDHPLPMTLDADRVGQVMANLIENALKFASSSVTVHVGGDPHQVTVAVSDDGPGIDPTDMPHVFERSYVARAAPSDAARRPTGSGLGLAIARELVGAMGGAIGAGANPSGTGTTVRFTLPRTSA